MPYTTLLKCFKIAQYAQFKHGDKITLDQLKQSITMIIQTVNEFTIDRYVEMGLEDHEDLAKPQWIKKDGFFHIQANRPKTANEVIAEAYREQQEKLMNAGKKALEDLKEGEKD